MEFAVYTYGHFKAMWMILNGIKMIMSSPFADSLIKLMALITTGYYAIHMMQHANNNGAGKYFAKTAGMLVIINALLLPKADIWVMDRITKEKEKIDDLPYAFVLPVGVLEAFGAGITAAFEQVFTPVGSAAYKDYGLIFGQRLVQESRNWRIGNPEFVRNMDVFLNRCVILESMIGSRFTPNDILHTEDILQLVREKAGTFRRVDFRIKGRDSRVTCKEAAKILEEYITTTELQTLGKKYTKSDFGVAGSMLGNLISSNANPIINNATGLSQYLKRNIELGYSGALGVDTDAATIMRQNMMINAIHDYTNKSDLYGYTRAANMQESNWKISGDLAKEYLPLLLNVMKGMIYASFIFIVPLMILSGGMYRYMRYIAIIASLQLWPALNSILNLFIELYSHNTGSAITGGVLNFANFNQAHDAIDKIVLVASGLQMSIPFLAFALVQGGVGGFVHLASSLSGASAGAASMAAGELTSGSRSFDNISKGNMQIAQQFAHTTDLNASYMEGGMMRQLADGSKEYTHPNMSSAIISGAGINMSMGSKKFDLNESTHEQIEKAYNTAKSLAKIANFEYTDAKNATMGKTAEFIANITSRELSGKTINYDTLGEQGTTVQQMVNLTKSSLKDHKNDLQKAANTSVKAYADISTGTPDAVNMISPVKFKAGVSGEAGLNIVASDNKSLSESESVTKNNDTNKTFNNLVKAASNESWARDHSIDTSLAESVKASYDDMQHWGETLSMRNDNVKTYSDAIHHTDSMSASTSQDLYHEVERRIQQQYGVSQKQAHDMIENGDKRVGMVWNNMVGENVNKLTGAIHAGHRQVSGKYADDKMQTFKHEHHNKVNSNNLDSVTKKASEDGLNVTKIKQDMHATKTKLQSNVKHIQAENAAKEAEARKQSNIVENNHKKELENLQNQQNEIIEDVRRKAKNGTSDATEK